MKMFSGEKWGRVEMMARRAEMKRMLREESTGRGIGWIEAGAVVAAAFLFRYCTIRWIKYGPRVGPRVKRTVLILRKSQYAVLGEEFEGMGTLKS